MKISLVAALAACSLILTAPPAGAQRAQTPTAPREDIKADIGLKDIPDGQTEA